jgi:hypothetical protein
VLLNNRLQLDPASDPASAPAGPLVTAKGEELPRGALVLWATGTRPATGLMKPALAEALDSDGLIKASGGNKCR